MRAIMNEVKDVAESFREDQRGIGVVEIILILVKIFTGKPVCILCI